MSEREHERLRTALGAYVLGQLSAAEAMEVEEHLDGCASCTAEVAELAPVARALEDLRAHAPQDDSEVPAGLGDRVLDAVDRSARAETRRQWPRTAGIAAAAAAVALVVTLGVQQLTEEEQKVVPLEAVPVQVESPGVRATADLVNHTWGVEVKLHATGFDRGGRYRVAVLGLDGEPHPAGEFVGTGARAMDCNLNSSVLREQASGFEVLDASGQVVVSSTFG